MAINNFGLIFDRRQSDVDHALRLRRDGIHTGEQLRGAYNASDRNRVAGALNFLLDTLRRNGYQDMGRVRAGWREGDIVKAGDNANMLAQLRAARRVLSKISLEIPDSLDNLSWQLANAVERILFEMFENYERFAEIWLWCGEGYAGHDFEEARLDDWWA